MGALDSTPSTQRFDRIASEVIDLRFFVESRTVRELPSSTHSSHIAFPEADIGVSPCSSVQKCSGINTNPLVVDTGQGQLGTSARANAFEMP
jgi:hypothetical protein